MRRSFLTLVVTSVLSWALFLPMPINASPEKVQSITTPQQKEKQPTITKFAHLIFGTLAFQLCFITASSETQLKLIDQLKPQNLLMNFALEYGTSFFVTFMHELGHALAAKYLNGNPISIHMGISPTDLDDEDHVPLFASEHITIHGLNPNQALTNYSIILNITTYLKRKLAEYLLTQHTDLTTLTPEKSHEILQKIIHDNQHEIDELITKTIPENIKKQAAILLAGSCSGATSAMLVNVLMTMIKKNSISPQTLVKGLSPTSQVFRNLTNMVIPRSADGHDDASKLYHQCMGVPKEPLAAIAEFAPLASLAAETWLAYDEADQKAADNWGSIGFIALANYMMRGYLRFTV